MVSQYALHVQCFWRITGPDGEVVSENDFPTFNPETGKRIGERTDDKAQPFYARIESAALVVQSIDVSTTGNVRVEITEGYTLEVVPKWGRTDEQWRLLTPGDPDSHFVVSGLGVEPLI